MFPIAAVWRKYTGMDAEPNPETGRREERYEHVPCHILAFIGYPDGSPEVEAIVAFRDGKVDRIPVTSLEVHV